MWLVCKFLTCKRSEIETVFVCEKISFSCNLSQFAATNEVKAVLVRQMDENMCWSRPFIDPSRTRISCEIRAILRFFCTCFNCILGDISARAAISAHKRSSCVFAKVFLTVCNKVAHQTRLCLYLCRIAYSKKQRTIEEFCKMIEIMADAFTSVVALGSSD